ncbi:hypothetical protein DY000_02046361 [Brassica cretica]|uniref:Uncharacterized protein n=1 Tax=Brassica cretica TaxID=69181 RepID=A0ABQ7F4F4_BRACR|nr:hypothetical protein DY000_02046361 [Brassica cretica]
MIKMDHEKTKSRSGNRPRDLVRLNNMKRASWTSDETAGRCENEARSAGRSSDKLSVAHIKFGQLRYKGVGRVDGELGKATSQLDQLVYEFIQLV